MNKIKFATLLLSFCALTMRAHSSWTTGTVPEDGVYKFTFGVDSAAEGFFAVPASATYDVQGTGYYDGTASAKFSYGFLGTTDTSYQTDIPASPSCSEPSAIDGFQVVQGQKIILHDATDANSVTCVKGPLASEYLPANASQYEGRYPIRFSMRGEERAYYAVTCTVVNVSSTTNADVTIFSERQHIIAHHLALAPGETKTFAWSVELAPNVYKTQGTYYDNAVNISVVGENAALASVTIVKQPQTSGTVRGASVSNMNVGKTIWLCTDSTGTDQKNATPFFSLQNYSGVGSGLSRWAPANISIRNQGEGGLATNANTHRKSCLLKPGDYLYVEYGHNESGAESYTNNLEQYLADVEAAGAYLLIVSPVERRSKWDSETSTWGRSLGGYATAGEAWVEDKILNHNKRNVAFIDLNKRYNDWMNEELRRINAINPNVSLNAAISFYYKSSKGANVDNTHINNAGTDQAAYWVWYDALQRVADGENAEEGSAAKVQADVLKGITEGYQGVVGIGGTAENLPWQVTDDIINAGVAPNTFWDTPVSTGYDYVNDAVVANVAAWTNADNTVTISNVTMRILNPDNYYKAVIDIISADGATTNRYWSYYNYDIGGAGKVSGDLVDPNEPGFLNADKDKADVSAADLATLTIPAGGKALVWIAKADAGTWQVGANEPCSPKYPVEWWSEVILDDDCSDASTWTLLTQAVVSTNVVEDALYFTTSGANSDNTKKNFGYYPPRFSSEMGAGRYRITFKVKSDSGTVNFQLGDSINSTTTLFHNNTGLLSINGTRVTGYGSTKPQITVVTEEDTEGEITTTTQNLVNKLRWMDVDIILDRDNDRAYVSVGGSDYAEYRNAAFLPGSYSGRTWNFFGITCPGQQSSYGYVDDVKVVKLASVEYPTVTAAAAPSDATLGTVTINGYETDSLTVYSGNDFIIKAMSADPDMYAFECWKDGEGNTVSTSPNLFIANATEDIDYTAQFREYAREENRVLTWDFSDFIVDGVAATANLTTNYNGLAVYLQNGDSLSGDGLYWAKGALKTSGSTAGADSRHIEWTAPADGTVTIVFQLGGRDSGKDVNPYLCVQTNDVSMGTANWYAYSQPKTVATDATLTFAVEAGTLYKIYSYYYNRECWVKIKSITYTYAPVRYTATAAVGNPGLGGATVNGGASSDVLAGKSATFTAWPVTAAYKFVNWTDGESNVASTDATFATNITEDVTYTANFEAVEAGESVNAEVNFAQYAGDGAISGGSLITTNGYFTIYTSDSSYGTDSITGNGIYWHAPANDIYTKQGYSADQPCDYVHYMKFEPPYSGTVTIVFQADKVVSSRTLSLNITSGELSGATKNNALESTSASTANVDFTLSYSVTAGETYWIWGASQNWSGAGNPTATTISSITYTHASDMTTLSLSNDSRMGTVYVNGAANVESCNVQMGETIHFEAVPASERFQFVEWRNASGETVSTDAEFWVAVADAVSLAAVWQRVNNFETVEIDVEEGETTKQIEAIDADGNVEKTGAGELILIGSNSFAGELIVSGGTVKVGGSSDFTNVLYDFDAQNASTVIVDEENEFTEWRDSAGSNIKLTSTGNALPDYGMVNGVFGDNPIVGGTNLTLKTSSAVTPLMSFVVCQYPTMTATDTVLMSDAGNSKSWNVFYRNGTSKYQVRNYNTYTDTGYVWQNGSSTTALSTKEQLMTVKGKDWIRYSSANISYGNGGNFRVAEILTFTAELDDEYRVAVEDYLMKKWGLKEGLITPIPATADVIVKDGATLDMGNAVPLTVTTMTLESGATLKLPAIPANGIVANTTFGTVGVVEGVNIVTNGVDVTADYVLRQTATALVIEEREPPVYEYDSDENVTQTGAFASYKGKASIVKNGAGTLTILGNNTFTGDIVINAGTIRMGGSLDIPGLLYDFDVSAVDAVVTNEVGEFSALKDAKGTSVTLGLSSGATAPEVVTDAFGGRKSLYSEKLRLQASVLFKTRANQNTAFLVWRTAISAYTQPMGDINDSNVRWAVGRHNTSSSIYEVMDYNTYYSGYTWGDGVLNAPVKSQTDQLLTIDGSAHRWIRADGSNNSRPFFGSNADCHIGEAIMSTAVMTEVERQGCEAMLMHKWGISDSYTALPVNANVSIANGATLDLGGLTQTVAALSVAEGGVVTNGMLVVTSEPVIVAGACAKATDNGNGTWNVIYKSPAPTTNDENAEVTDNGDGTYTVEVQAETVALTIPENVMVSEVVVSTNTTTVTVSGGGSLPANVKVAVSWTDGETPKTAQYSIVTVGAGGAITLNEEAIVTVDEEQIPLKPTPTDSSDATTPPFVVGDDVSVGIKAIPGLVYRLVRGTELNSITSTIATKKATSSRISLSDNDPLEGAAFYKITVDVK